MWGILFIFYIFILILTYALCKAASKDGKFREADKEKR